MGAKPATNGGKNMGAATNAPQILRKHRLHLIFFRHIYGTTFETAALRASMLHGRNIRQNFSKNPGMS